VPGWVKKSQTAMKNLRWGRCLFYFIRNLRLTLIIFNIILNIIKEEVTVTMSIEFIPDWMVNLEDEDIVFIKKFLLVSGSLKEMAKQYGVTYPTVRLRLDRLIQKIQISEDVNSEPYIALIKRLAVNEKLGFDTAKLLMSEYKKTKLGGE